MTTPEKCPVCQRQVSSSVSQGGVYKIVMFACGARWRHDYPINDGWMYGCPSIMDNYSATSELVAAALAWYDAEQGRSVRPIFDAMQSIIKTAALYRRAKGEQP